MTDAERIALWKEIQSKAPLMVETLKAHLKVFGKPVEIKVRFKNAE